MQFGRGNFTLSLVAYITVDFKKLLSNLFHTGPILVDLLIHQEKNEAIRIVPKHNNSLETFPYLIQKYLAMHQSDFTLQISS